MQPISKRRVISILENILRQPTAPFMEERVAEQIRAFCRGRRTMKVKEDRFGNLVVRYRRGKVGRAEPLLVFAAHMDHPGFVAGRRNSKKETVALFLGGVRRSFFKGSKVRFFHDGTETSGPITSVKPLSRAETHVQVKTRREIPEGALGMWDLKAFRRKGERIYSRAMDDLAGVAAILALLDALDRGKVSGEAAGLFTRGEEVGLNGATAIALSRGVPLKRSRIITVETSKELVNARVGAGPIIRVGDRRMVFDAGITSFMHMVAEGLAKKQGGFPYQRRLMDGGTCESSSFSVLGYRTGAACVALGNYHNMSADGRIREEYIHEGDLHAMVRLFVEMVRRRAEIEKGSDPLRAELVKNFERYEDRLVSRRKR